MLIDCSLSLIGVLGNSVDVLTAISEPMQAIGSKVYEAGNG